MFARVIFPLAWGALVLPALFAASAIAWRLGNGPELGAPLLGDWIYPPWALVRWLGEWDLAHEPTRALFVQGALLAFVPGALATVLLGIRMVSSGALSMPRNDERERYMGTPRALCRHGGFASEGDGVVLGKSGRKILRVRGDGHVLVTGPSGSGKTVGPIVGTLLEHGGSMIVFDPKRELAAITGRHRAQLGATFVFDPTEPFSDHYNPLLELRQGEHLHGDCEIVAGLIARSGTSKEPIWEDAAAELITALLLVAFEQQDPRLSHVQDLMLALSAGMAPATRNGFAQRVIAAHMALEDRVRSSVNFETREALSFMSDPIVREITSRSDFKGSDAFCGDHPTTVFIQVPPADQDRLRPLMRVVLQVLTNAGLHRLRETVDGRAKTRDVMLLLEEFPALRRMPFLETQLAVCRAFGVRCFLACQDRAQIRRSYSDKEAITSNMHVVAVMPGFSDSLRDLEEWGGWAMQTTRTRGREILRPLSARRGEAEERRPILNPADLLKRRDDVLVFALGHAPTWLRRVRYFNEPKWRGMWDG